MMSRGRWLLASIAAVALLVAPMPAAATVIFFDDFEAVGNQPPSLNTVPVGWTVTDGTVDLVGTGGGGYGYLCAGSPSPGTCVDLDGSTGNAGTLHRPSRTWLRARTSSASGPRATRGAADDTMNVYFGTDLITLTHVSGSPWPVLQLPGRRRDTPESGPLVRHGGGDNIGILIDNVQVDAVPEPGTLLLIGSGLTGLALRRRRRQG